MHYKYKKDFAVLSFGDHFSHFSLENVVGKIPIDICTVKTENSVKRHFVNVSRGVCEKFRSTVYLDTS